MKPWALVIRKLLPEAQDFLDRQLDVEIGAEDYNNIDVVCAAEKGIWVAGLSGGTPPNIVSISKLDNSV
ncbi:MAG: hypothetical protein WBB73_01425 [Candidatus Aminicenantaceae bacterium]